MFSTTLRFISLRYGAMGMLKSEIQPFTVASVSIGIHSIVKSRSQSTTMLHCCQSNYPGKNLREVLQHLEGFAPLNFAESWDNVGLLVDPMENVPVKNILLTNDLTEDVLEEAISASAGLIISYHPNIFHGLKSVTAKTWKERIIVKCIKHNIAVFSPHTSWDAVQGGVNDWLSEAFEVNSKTPIIENPTNPSVGAGRLCILKKPITVEKAVESVKSHIGIPHLRLALGKNKIESDTISSIALCAGSGSSVLRGVKADLYLTGEMLHHDVLEATQNGIHVILCNHSDSERGFLKVFQTKLQNELLEEKVGVIIAINDRDPLKTV
ncbi:hypothetical protein ILUMI_10463 [Ignelater luminosus]|uniref:NIF3-like protein 1 n=1 Tax=Ignelater luminosus TaxID=2038154 RepID=A0A8K0D379_IGNLU|nr:hypothetical protein ILUMI_10463 [Ignelater luminosus]